MTNQTIELRNYDVSLSEVNETSDGLLLVKGIVNRPGSWSEPLPAKNGKAFIERIMPNTFANAIKRGGNIKFLKEHNRDKLLASTKNGTLKLEETPEGLYMEARISPTQYGKDTYQLIKDGELSSMSFGMTVLKNTWEKAGEIMKRTITDLALSEVSCVSDPAYVQSNIQARSIEVVNEIEIPNINERKLSEMNIKELQELKTKILNENKELLTTEARSLDEAQKYCRREIVKELRSIDEKIQSVEYTNKTETREVITMNKNNAFETETRAVEQFIRQQDGEELRAMQANIGTQAGTGFLTIPTTMSDYIVEKLNENAPLFGRTKNFTPVNGFLEILREKSIGTGAFVGEMAEDVTPNDFTMDKIRLEQKRAVTAIELSQHLVNDSGIDVVNYSISLLSRRLGLALDNSVLIGKKEKGEFEGILNDLTIGEQAGLATNAITVDELLDLYNSMNPEYIGGAVWVVSRQTFNMLSKLKNDKNGEYYLVRDVATTGPIFKLFGQPVIINDTMPAPEAGQRAVLFANFSEGYATMTKKGLNLQHITGDTKQALRGSHMLVLDTYVDGKVLNPAAIKVLKMKA
ncbi:phage major capsid protein [Bacillus thuringiensis]|uniref:Phage major capsid protein n=1 Tax=Bacillus thuringiensis subsp. darmstadiensis TaxID=132264 RepID=A0A9X6IRC2_BACUD|nr:phage major capsid protein [Bacillus thuringiensis]ADH06299.1 Phage prohead protease [Bacillus thuringiensis BMB171]ADH09529.1 Phage prohead protease [Bacillus thuringiensis BMB171]OTZ29029.1 phage major capsid protein [Bacillus thuringiensis serovar darmstadiensis]OTZ33804.1 phage major capsid protein [Bacillus thuringiensis serovar darmstadiensis]OTZ34074.1 phage major capsid protein [Bacillus thuringiensis serovar darmstadiensis]